MDLALFIAREIEYWKTHAAPLSGPVFDEYFELMRELKREVDKLAALQRRRKVLALDVGHAGLLHKQPPKAPDDGKVCFSPKIDKPPPAHCLPRKVNLLLANIPDTNVSNPAAALINFCAVHLQLEAVVAPELDWVCARIGNCCIAKARSKQRAAAIAIQWLNAGDNVFYFIYQR